MGLSCHAAAADPFLLQSGRGAGALVLSGMGLDVRLDFATPAGSRWSLPLRLEFTALCCCPVGFFAGRESCWLSPDLQPAHTSCGQLGN